MPLRGKKKAGGRKTQARSKAPVRREKVRPSGHLVLKLNLKIPAERSAIDPIVQKVMAEVRKVPHAHGKEDAIELALTEALANAVVHGCKCDPGKTVACSVATDKRGVLIVVRDQGNGFNPKNLPNPLEDENLYASHGRGIFLIHRLMDEVRYHRNGTEIRMLKR
jgi:serine/threonine-protein kinase RsbW